MIRLYTLSETDLAIIRQRRGRANRLGFAVHVCYLRFPAVILSVDQPPFPPLLRMVAQQLKVPVESWDEYGLRDQTRREHLIELQTVFGFKPFTATDYRQSMSAITELALQTDNGVVWAETLIETLRRQSVILPAINVIEPICAEAITRANRRIHAALIDPLSKEHRERLDQLLTRKDGGKVTWLAWLRQSPAKANSRSMLEHIERLKAMRELDLPVNLVRAVHQNRLLTIAREGAPMTPADLAKFEPQRRCATLAALVIEGTATIVDEIIDLHDRFIGRLFQTAKHRHEQRFQESSKAINDKLRLYGRVGQALLEAKRNGGDPSAAIESVLSWDAFVASVTEAQKLAQPDDFDFLHRIGESYATLRRYAPQFLNALTFRAAPAAKSVLDGVETLRTLYADNARKVPADAPTGFIKKRWEKLVSKRASTGVDVIVVTFIALAGDIIKRILREPRSILTCPPKTLPVIVRVLQFRKENKDEEEPVKRREDHRGGEAGGRGPESPGGGAGVGCERGDGVCLEGEVWRHAGQ